MWIKFPLIYTLLFILLLTGCTQKTHKVKQKPKKTTALVKKEEPKIIKPLMYKVSQEELNESLQKGFPLNKDFLIGKYTLSNPQIQLTQKDERLHASVDIQLVTLLTGQHKGVFSISGNIFFDKNKGQVYLQNPIIKQLTFEKKDISTAFPKAVSKDVYPLINTLFKQYPLYTIPKSSFLGSFVKEIKIAEKELLVYFGI